MHKSYLKNIILPITTNKNKLKFQLYEKKIEIVMINNSISC